jgi:hypothetical protein
MWLRFPHKPTAYDDDLEDQPRQGAFYKWILGVLLPIGIACYGIFGIVEKQIEFGSEVSWTFHGKNAIALGIACLSASLFLHCHYFWGNIYDQIWFAVLGKIISACGFIVGLVYVLIHNGILGIG